MGPQSQQQVRHVPVYEEYKAKHFTFSMAQDGSTEPKMVGEWLTTQSLGGWELSYKVAEFRDGFLQIYCLMKRLRERKCALPDGVVNTKVLPMGVPQ